MTIEPENTLAPSGSADNSSEELAGQRNGPGSEVVWILIKSNRNSFCSKNKLTKTVHVVGLGVVL